VKISYTVKLLGLWISGILFFSEIFGEILLISSYMLRIVKNYLLGDFIFNIHIAGNVISDFLMLLYLIVGIVFLSQLFNHNTTLKLSSYRWVYSMSVLIFCGFLVRYLSNSYSVEKILSFDFNLIIIFISLTFIFFFQKAYKNIADGKYSYMIFILLSFGYYLFYLLNIAPLWEYHRIISW